MALSRVVSAIFNVKKYRDLEIPVNKESGTILNWYRFLLVFYSNFVPNKTHHFAIFDFKNTVTLKTGLVVRQGHCKCHYTIERI